MRLSSLVPSIKVISRNPDTKQSENQHREIYGQSARAKVVAKFHKLAHSPAPTLTVTATLVKFTSNKQFRAVKQTHQPQ